MDNPVISVIMPVYNEQSYLHDAIDSILNQSYPHFEFLIFNDGSTDASLEIIKSYQDPRIKVFNFTKNQGYVVHLNQGIIESKGKYIARMDADDIALPTRFQMQVDFMESHPEIGISGGWFKKADSQLVQKYALGHEAIKTSLLNHCPMVHPTVIMRRSEIIKFELFYDPKYLYSEDFELWCRAIHNIKFANIPEVLIIKRIHPECVSVLFRERQKKQSEWVRKKWIRFFTGRSLTPMELSFIKGELPLVHLNQAKTRQFSTFVLLENNRCEIFKKDFLEAQLHYSFFINFAKAAVNSPQVSLKTYFKILSQINFSFLQKRHIRQSVVMKFKRLLFDHLPKEESSPIVIPLPSKDIKKDLPIHQSAIR